MTPALLLAVICLAKVFALNIQKQMHPDIVHCIPSDQQLWWCSVLFVIFRFCPFIGLLKLITSLKYEINGSETDQAFSS